MTPEQERAAAEYGLRLALLLRDAAKADQIPLLIAAVSEMFTRILAPLSVETIEAILASTREETLKQAANFAVFKAQRLSKEPK